MKTIRKFAALIIALVIAVMGSVLVACDGDAPNSGNNGDNPGISGKPNDGENQGGNTGDDKGENQGENPGTNPGTEPGTNPGTNPGDNPGISGKPKIDLDKVVENLAKQELNSLIGSTVVTPTKNEYAYTEDGETKLTRYTYGGNNFFEGSIKANYADGDADIIVKVCKESPEGEEYCGDQMCIYSVVRDWEAYTDSVKKEDVEAGTFDWYDEGNAVDLVGIHTDLYEKAARFNHFFMFLGNVYDTATVSGDTVTVDFVKTAYSIINGLNALIDKLTPDMTVGELMLDRTVNNLMCAVLNTVTPAEMAEGVKSYIERGNGKYPDALLDLLDEVKPDEGSTTVEYLFKLMDSDAARDLVADILYDQMDIVLPENTKLGDIKLGFWADAFELYEKVDATVELYRDDMPVTDFASMKAAIKYIFGEVFKNATKDMFVCKMLMGSNTRSMIITVSELKLVYTVANDKVTKVHIASKYGQEFIRNYSDGSGNKETFACEATADLEFTDEKQTLMNVTLPEKE